MVNRVFPIGVVGLGEIGLSMARVLSDVREVRSYDADPAVRDHAASLGVPVAASLTDLAQVCRVVVLCLPSVEAVEQAVEEIATRSPGRLVLDTGVRSPDDARRIGGLALALGTTYLDTPVSGGPGVVGRWTVRMGGPAAAYAVVADVFEAVASEVVHVGELGSANSL